jgi:sulfur relay (sulfurtransferase) DsrF/TusC family protein
MQKEMIEVWSVYEIEDGVGTEMQIGTLRKIKEFALELFDDKKCEKYQRSFIENGDEHIIFQFLDEYGYDVQHVCDVHLDEFNLNRIDYTTNI